MLACCHDTGYIPVLRQYAAQASTLGRLTLLGGGTRLRSDISSLGFSSTNLFETMFSSANSKSITGSPAALKAPAVFPALQSSPSNTPVNFSYAQLASRGKTADQNSQHAKRPARLASRLRPVVRNDAGKRIDKPLKQNESLMNRLRDVDLCHWHYLRAECKTASTSCAHNHLYPGPLTPQEYDALWILSRQNPCRKSKKSGVCEDDQCIYGHVPG